MKLYTFTYDANQPTIQQLNVPTNTSFLIGVKATKNEQPVEIDTSKAVLIADNGDQTKADEVLTNGYVTFQISSTDEAFLTTYSLDVDGDAVGDFKLILNIVKSGVGETSDIDAVEAKIPTKTSQLTNDSEYITSKQVKPSIRSGFGGWAENAAGSMFLWGRNSSNTPNTNKFVTINFNNSDKLVQDNVTYDPWMLEMFNGTTFDPPLEMTYDYQSTITYYMNRRAVTTSIRSNCWYKVVGNRTADAALYFIKQLQDDNGLPILDNTLYSRTGIGNLIPHPITFSSNQLSVVTMDGEAGNIICTRPSAKAIDNYRYIAYEDDVATWLSAKVDTSALNNYYTKAEVDALIAQLRAGGESA